VFFFFFFFYCLVFFFFFALAVVCRADVFFFFFCCLLFFFFFFFFSLFSAAVVIVVVACRPRVLIWIFVLALGPCQGSREFPCGTRIGPSLHLWSSRLREVVTGPLFLWGLFGITGFSFPPATTTRRTSWATTFPEKRVTLITWLQRPVCLPALFPATTPRFNSHYDSGLVLLFRHVRHTKGVWVLRTLEAAHSKGTCSLKGSHRLLSLLRAKH